MTEVLDPRIWTEIRGRWGSAWDWSGHGGEEALQHCGADARGKSMQMQERAQSAVDLAKWAPDQ